MAYKVHNRDDMPISHIMPEAKYSKTNSLFKGTTRVIALILGIFVLTMTLSACPLQQAINQSSPKGDDHSSTDPVDSLPQPIDNNIPDTDAICGNGICEATESCHTCRQDCASWTDRCIGTTYYASPSGRGSGLTGMDPFEIADFWNVAQPGDVLLLTDGEYTGSRSMIKPPVGLHGTASQRIVIRAQNDGRALINGEHKHVAVSLSGNNYLVLEGFNACCGAAPSSGVIRLSMSNHNIIRRVVAWDAADGNTNVIGISRGNYNLIEDVGAFGSARKVLGSTQEGNHTTFRRCWARWEGSHTHGPKMAISLFYNHYHMTVENSIFTWDGLQMRNNYQVTTYQGEIYLDSNGQPITMTDHKVYHPTGVVANDGVGAGYSPIAHLNANGNIIYVKASARYGPAKTYGLEWNRPALNLGQPGMHLNHTLVVYENEPLYLDTLRLIQLAPTGDASELNRSSAKNQSWLGGATGSRDVWIDDASKGNTWTTQNIYRNANCKALTKNLGHSHILDLSSRGGASIMKRYINGQLTNEDLWPWPMNERILDATTKYSSKPVDVTREVFELCGGKMPKFN